MTARDDLAALLVAYAYPYGDLDPEECEKIADAILAAGRRAGRGVRDLPTFGR